jgi:hypothetical protein
VPTRGADEEPHAGSSSASSGSTAPARGAASAARGPRIPIARAAPGAATRLRSEGTSDLPVRGRRRSAGRGGGGFGPLRPALPVTTGTEPFGVTKEGTRSTDRAQVGASASADGSGGATLRSGGRRFGASGPPGPAGALRSEREHRLPPVESTRRAPERAVGRPGRLRASTLALRCGVRATVPGPRVGSGGWSFGAAAVRRSERAARRLLSGGGGAGRDRGGASASGKIPPLLGADRGLLAAPRSRVRTPNAKGATATVTWCGFRRGESSKGSRCVAGAAPPEPKGPGPTLGASRNATNPTAGSGMQQARRACAEQAVEVVRNHEDGTRWSGWSPLPDALRGGSGRAGGGAVPHGRHTAPGNRAERGGRSP